MVTEKMKEFDDTLYKWTKSLTGVEKRELLDCGGGVFLGLRQLRVEEDFLDACLEYWTHGITFSGSMGARCVP